MADTKFRIGLVNDFPTASDSVCYIDVDSLDQALRIQRQVKQLGAGAGNPVFALIECYDAVDQQVVF